MMSFTYWFFLSKTVRVEIWTLCFNTSLLPNGTATESESKYDDLYGDLIYVR